MGKKVFIYAYTQMNLGDDLFIKILCNRYPDVKFYITCNKNLSNAFKDIPNLIVIPKVFLLDRILRRLKINISINDIIDRCISYYCFATVNIGGSIFIQNTNWKNKIKRFEKRVNSSKQYYIISSNFGPFSDEDYYLKYKKIFQKVKDICFREEYSYNLFSDLSNTRYASDAGFLFKPKTSLKEQNHVIVSIIDLSTRKKLKDYENAYLYQVINLCRDFVRKGYTVYLMGFCEKEGDKYAIDKIMKSLSSDELKYIKSYIYQGNLEEAICLIEESKCILATRFHAMIIGWVCGKPVYPIIYSDKSLNAMKDVGFNGWYTTIKKINEITSENVVNYLLDIKPIDIERQVDLAQLQFKNLDSVLGD